MAYTEMIRRRKALRILRRVRQHIRDQRARAQDYWMLTARNGPYLAAERAEGIIQVATLAVYGLQYGPVVRGESTLRDLRFPK
jgi:hypothetical protein